MTPTAPVLALSKIDEKAYGNDFINWLASPPSPGLFDTLESFEEWQIFWNLESADDNPDRDSLINIFEYAFDRNPLVRDSSELIKILRAGENIRVTYPLEARRPDLEIQLEYSPNLKEWSSVQTEVIESQNQADITDLASGYYRIRILKTSLVGPLLLETLQGFCKSLTNLGHYFSGTFVMIVSIGNPF